MISELLLFTLVGHGLVIGSEERLIQTAGVTQHAAEAGASNQALWPWRPHATAVDNLSYEPRALKPHAKGLNRSILSSSGTAESSTLDEVAIAIDPEADHGSNPNERPPVITQIHAEKGSKEVGSPDGKSQARCDILCLACLKPFHEEDAAALAPESFPKNIYPSSELYSKERKQGESTVASSSKVDLPELNEGNNVILQFLDYSPWKRGITVVETLLLAIIMFFVVSTYKLFEPAMTQHKALDFI